MKKIDEDLGGTTPLNIPKFPKKKILLNQIKMMILMNGKMIAKKKINLNIGSRDKMDKL